MVRATSKETPDSRRGRMFVDARGSATGHGHRATPYSRLLEITAEATILTNGTNPKICLIVEDRRTGETDGIELTQQQAEELTVLLTYKLDQLRRLKAEYDGRREIAR